MSLPRASRMASYCMRRSSSAECCCVCRYFANVARARSTASFSAAVPALASNSHVCRPTWLFSEKRSLDNARTIGLAESRPESEHRSLHMTRARERTPRCALRPRLSRDLERVRSTRAPPELRGVPTSFQINVPRQRERVNPTSWLLIDRRPWRAREPSVKSAHTYALLVCDKLWNTFFTRFKDSATVRDVQIFSEFFGFESGCRMDRSRGSRGSALVSVARAAEVDRVFFLCASLSHRGLRSRGGRKPAQRRRRARLHLRTRS